MKHLGITRFGIIYAIVVATVLWTTSPLVRAHCEIPCGIYDDAARIAMIIEHIGTIEKSMNQILEIEKKQPIHYNQLVRWITNKEDHANEIQEIVTQYFMTQRINFDTDKYMEKLSYLHKMLVFAMQCKQSTDLSRTAELRKAVEAFAALYFAGQK
jgi:nickel superoxide dismutase